jgi:hypothetical protein
MPQPGPIPPPMPPPPIARAPLLPAAIEIATSIMASVLLICLLHFSACRRQREDARYIGIVKLAAKGRRPCQGPGTSIENEGADQSLGRRPWRIVNGRKVAAL